MLKGIDVSSWQGNIQVQNMPVDFVIAKATEGLTYVNEFCDPVIRNSIQGCKLWGFYHYGQCNEPREEADYFIDNTINYFGSGIPVLDWEENQSVEWVNIFVNRVHERTGVWPWIYANPWRFNQGGVEPNCMRWIASYPDVLRPGLDYDPGEPPETDGLVGCWQYASDGQVPGYAGNLNVNHFFGSVGAWQAYAGIPSSGQPDPSPSQSVLENDRFRVTIEEK